ncbi:MAG: DUF2164 domain-containing protein [Halioglobus sp.]|nr:DUF2164 domain-containing protein [Halioglobus sp.]
MADIKFNKEEREAICRRIQLYFHQELEQDIGQFDAGFLLDFFAEEIGPFFYNRGLYDAQALLESRMESVAEAIYELEKPAQNVR